MLRATLKDHIRTEVLPRKTGVVRISQVVAKFKQNWIFPLTQMQDEQWIKRLLEWRLRAEKRSKRRPPICWSNNNNKELPTIGSNSTGQNRMRGDIGSTPDAKGCLTTLMIKNKFSRIVKPKYLIIKVNNFFYEN